MGYSRQQFYEIRRKFQTCGAEGLIDRLPGPHPNRVAAQVEAAILDHALETATAERRLELSEEQTRLLERFSPEFRERHIQAPHTDSLVAVDTFFVGRRASGQWRRPS